MRIPAAEHAALPWRISELVPDFELIDAWALPVSGHGNELGALEAVFLGFDPSSEGGRLTGMLFALRRQLGLWFGWDQSANALPIPGCRETSLRERLPPDLRSQVSATGDRERFRLIYRTATEWARERSNATVHAVLHVGWVSRGDGTYHAQLGVYVKPRGWFGRVYMAAIRPFRHLIVYPSMIDAIGRVWAKRSRD